jgi:SAM-dependent methyltransferase
MQTQVLPTTTPASTNAREFTTIPYLKAIKATQKATWESGDFGQIARSIEDAAEEFMARLPLAPNTSVLDAACGTGNLAVHAARAGCDVHGIDIARNLVAQARARATAEGLFITYTEGDVEAMPYGAERFDWVVSMFGVMFAPGPGLTVAELARVTRPGGHIAMANWTPRGFIGKMFNVFKKYRPASGDLPSPMSWGEEKTVRSRLCPDFTKVRLHRRIALMRFPFSPAETVEFFRQYYGPTQRAFAALDAFDQAALRRDLVELQTAGNISKTRGTTEIAAEYLEVIATRN